jgi:hypothetical protein
MAATCNPNMGMASTFVNWQKPLKFLHDSAPGKRRMAALLRTSPSLVPPPRS